MKSASSVTVSLTAALALCRRLHGATPHGPLLPRVTGRCVPHGPLLPRVTGRCVPHGPLLPRVTGRCVPHGPLVSRVKGRCVPHGPLVPRVTGWCVRHARCHRAVCATRPMSQGGVCATPDVTGRCVRHAQCHRAMCSPMSQGDVQTVPSSRAVETECSLSVDNGN